MDNSSDVEDVGGDEQGEQLGQSLPLISLSFSSFSPSISVYAHSSAWVPAYSAIDVAGPTFFFQRSRDSQDTNSASICLSLNPTSQQVVPSIITKSEPIDIKHLPSNLEIDPDLLDGAQIEQQDVDSSNSEANQFIPQSVHQVWVANRVSDSQVWTLRSAESKFLSADKHGIVTALSEARGPQEGWELIPLPPDVRDLGPVVALKSAHGTLLGTDEIAGGKKVVRADVAFPNSSSSGDGNGETSDLISKIPEIGASERWEVRVQWKHRHAAREKARGRDNKKQKGDGRERAAEKMSEDQLRLVN